MPASRRAGQECNARARPRSTGRLAVQGNFLRNPAYVKTKVAFDVEANVVRNILHARYFESVTAGHMKAGLQDVEILLPKMQAGFTVLADLSGLESMDLDCVPHVTKFMDLCKAQGAAMVVRVIPDPSKDIGFNILSIVHYRGKVKIVTCETMAEAERATQ